MSFFVNALQKGGPFMWPLVLLLVAGWVVPLAAVVLVALKRWVPALVWWLVPGLMLLIGAIGRIQGDTMASEAVAHASVETKSVLVHAGMSVAAFTEVSAWALSIGFLALTAQVLGIALPVGAGPRARWRVAPAVLSLLVCWVGAVAVAVLTFTAGGGLAHGGAAPLVLVAVLLMGGVSLALAALRGSEEPADSARLAAGVAAVATLVLGAALSAWMFGDLQGYILVHEAISRASPETRLALVAEGMAMRQGLLWPGVAALVFVALAGLTALSTSLGQALRPRTLVSALLWGAGGVLVAAPVAYGHLQAAQLEDRTVEAMAAKLIGVLPDLPVPSATGAETPVDVGLVAWQLSAVRRGAGWVQGPGSPDEGAPLVPPAVTDPEAGPVLLVMSATTPAQEVAGIAWAGTDGDPAPVELRVFVDQGTHPLVADHPWTRAYQAGALGLRWLPGAAWSAGIEEPPGSVLAALRGASLVYQPGDPAWEKVLIVEGRQGAVAMHTLAGSVEDIASLRAGLEDIASVRGKDAFDTVVLVPAASWTVQDLVGHCLTAQAVFTHEGDWRAETVDCALTAQMPTDALLAARVEAMPRDLLGGLGGLIGGEYTAPGLGGLGTRGGSGGGASSYGVSVGRLRGSGDGAVDAAGGEALILGSLDRTVIDTVVRRHLNQIRYCYQRELTSNPDLTGRMVVKFVVAGDGTVSSATTKSSTLGSAAVESCVSGRFMRMQFPEPSGGGIVIVSYPFVFRPG